MNEVDPFNYPLRTFMLPTDPLALKRERERNHFDFGGTECVFFFLEGEKIFREIERKKMASKSSLAATNNNSRTHVGKYELGRTLGEGNFAKVKFARNVDTGENVAIKILDKEKILKHKMIAQVLTVIIILIFQFIFSNRSNQIWFFFWWLDSLIQLC